MVSAPAKINLALHVVGRRGDGVVRAPTRAIDPSRLADGRGWTAGQRASNCSLRLRWNVGQASAPGTISLSAANSITVFAGLSYAQTV